MISSASWRPNSNRRAIKGPDFLSRLQAHIDIMGLDPPAAEVAGLSPDARDEVRKPYTMRKAILLRGLLEQWLPRIFWMGDDGKTADIDPDLVKKFLFEWDYKHGVRSMEAIIRMSALPTGRHYSVHCLPPLAQLSMHVRLPAGC
jgi:hypothetical protein